jgi:hypothetical protein
MPRVLSAAALQAIFARETDEVFVVLLTLEHSTFATAIRVCSDAVDTISRGSTYQPFPFEVTTPAEDDAPPPRVTLRIDNVDRRIVQEVRRVSGEPITVTLEVVLASTPDTLEAGPFEFALRDTTYSALLVEGELAFDDILNEPYPGLAFTPSVSPGLF